MVPTLELVDIAKRYGTTEAIEVLRGISFQLPRGAVCAITGPSGSGKTTLMNIIGLLDRPSSGTVRIGGVDVGNADRTSRAWLRNRHIGFVFQSFHLLPRLSILDNAALPLVYRGAPSRERRRVAGAWLDRVGLGEFARRMPDELSGGQRQRVAIARALVGSPSLLLADEPTGNLDPSTAGEIMQLFLGLNQELKLTIILVTHDPAVAERCFTRVHMRDGRIVEERMT